MMMMMVSMTLNKQIYKSKHLSYKRIIKKIVNCRLNLIGPNQMLLIKKKIKWFQIMRMMALMILNKLLQKMTIRLKMWKTNQIKVKMSNHHGLKQISRIKRTIKINRTKTKKMNLMTLNKLPQYKMIRILKNHSYK